MTAGTTSIASPCADELLSRLYQQVTEWQSARFGSDYGIEAGLDRYQTWLRDQGPGDDEELGRTVAELYQAHYRPLVRLAALLVHDVRTAEDVVQDSFAALHAGLHRLRDPAKALAYLRAAVVNRSRSVLRHRIVVDKHAPRPCPDLAVAGPEQLTLTLLDRSAVISALRNLPLRQREVVVLRFYADLSEAQIAATMGISRGAVKTHAARAISTLRVQLGKTDE
jgi:RNA polymerase sigma-70 factor (sigma-E family)